MARPDPVGYIRLTYDSGNGDAEVPEFIGCVDGQEPHNQEIWAFGSDGVTREVHPTAQIDVSVGVGGEFLYNHLPQIERRIPLLGKISIHGSVEHLGVPDFHRTGGPIWADNFLDPSYI